MQDQEELGGKVEMENYCGIMVDLDRCVGCYTCEVACQQENTSSQGTPWIRVNTIGPAMVNGKLRMDYVPLISDDCTFCRDRNFHPSCVAHCPTQALSVGSIPVMLDALSGVKRFQGCTIKRISK